MTKRLLIFLVILTSLSTAHGQSRKRKWQGANEYELLENDPNGRYPQVVFGVYPFSGHLTANFQLGAAVSAAIRHKNKWEILADYDQAVVDYSSGTPDFVNANTGHTVGFKSALASHVQVRGSYAFLKKEKKREGERIKLGGIGRTTYFMQVESPTNALWRLSIRAGYGYKNGLARLSSGFGGKFQGVEVIDASGQIIEFSASSGTYSTMASTHYVSLGFSFETQKHLLIELFNRNKKDPDNRRPIGKKKRHHATEYYFDLLVNAKSSLANMTVSTYGGLDQSEITLNTYELNSGTPALPVGFRIGRVTHDFAGIAGLSTGIEFGLPPGKAGISAAYLAIRIGLNINVLLGD